MENVDNRSQFLALLSTLEQRARLQGDWPVLHFETHGNPQGISLASGEFLSWEELKGPLSRLNVQTGNNLLVVLAACYGAYLTKVVVPTDRAPFWGLVGPDGVMFPEVLLRSFFDFYSEVFATENGTAALRRLNAAVRTDRLSYSFTQCEFFFKMVYYRYLQENFHPRALKRRAQEIYMLAKKSGAASPHPREIKRTLLQTREQYFEKHRETFFMYDLYPENRKRFAVKYQDIIDFKPPTRNSGDKISS